MNFKSFVSIYIYVLTIFAYSNESIRIGFMGDVMFGRKDNPIMDQQNYSFIWGDVISELKRNDLNIANLETTLTNHTERVRKRFNFKSNPTNARALVEGKIHVVNLANNHIFDYGYQGIRDTLLTLDNCGILHVGAGLSVNKAGEPLVIKRNGLRIGILGYTDDGKRWRATASTPGHNYMDISNVKPLIAVIKTIRSKVDLLIITLHWGPNYRRKPTQQFIEFAHALIDAGADIIHGHSAHVCQALEVYKQKVIMYDTGDFVGDFTINTALHNDQSFLFVVSVGKRGINRIELVPVVIKNTQVMRAGKKTALTMIERMNRTSLPFGSEYTYNVSSKRGWHKPLVYSTK